jgi:lipid A 3-O-deacylase
MKRLLPIIGLLLWTSMALAQNRMEDGGHEIQIWMGGGHSVPGGTSNTGIFNLGGRYGWILTKPHGPGILKGRFEYAVDVVPVYLIFQPANTAYGAGFNPLGLKWNFATRCMTTPYFELNGGTLFTNHNVPDGTNTVNFTSSAAVGFQFVKEHRTWSVEVRYMHISNAGLEVPNPGLNTVQVRLGLGKIWGSR